MVLGQEGDGEDVEQFAAEHVERDLRARDVGHDQVEEPGREVDPRGLGEQGRRGEVVEPRDHLGAERLLRRLDPVHRLAHRAQPGDGVLDVDGQRPADGGDLVAELAALVRGPDRHRHERAQLEALGADAAGVQPAPQRAGDGAEDDVVDGAAELRLDLLEVGQVAAHPGVAAVRADRGVERQVGGGVGELPGDLADALGGLLDLPGGGARGADDRGDPPGGADRRLREALDAAGGERGARTGSGSGSTRGRAWPARAPA